MDFQVTTGCGDFPEDANYVLCSVYRELPPHPPQRTQIASTSNSQSPKEERVMQCVISSPGPAGLSFSKRRSDSNSEPLLTLAMRLKMGANQPLGLLCRFLIWLGPTWTAHIGHAPQNKRKPAPWGLLGASYGPACSHVSTPTADVTPNCSHA